MSDARVRLSIAVAVVVSLLLWFSFKSSDVDDAHQRRSLQTANGNSSGSRRRHAVEAVQFVTDDNAVIHAHLYRADSGSRGAVLAHGRAFDAASWREQAEAMRDAGISCLAINFRTYQSSTSGAKGPNDKWRDVVAAVDFLRNQVSASSVAVLVRRYDSSLFCLTHCSGCEYGRASVSTGGTTLARRCRRRSLADGATEIPESRQNASKTYCIHFSR